MKRYYPRPAPVPANQECEARRTPTGEMRCARCQAVWDLDEDKPDNCVDKQKQ